MSNDTNDKCCNRLIRSRFCLTYYDPKFILTTLQNNIDHYNEIPYVDIYKHYNGLLNDDIDVNNVNILYFAAQHPINLSLSASGEINLLTSEFYLYQPTTSFSFVLSDPGNRTDEECSVYVHLFYAKIKLPTETDPVSFVEAYDPNTGFST